MNPRQNSSNQSQYYGGGNNYSSQSNSYSGSAQNSGYGGGNQYQNQRGNSYGYGGNSNNGDSGGYNQGGGRNYYGGSGGGQNVSQSSYNQQNNNNFNSNHQQQNQHQFNPSNGYGSNYNQNQYRSYSNNQDNHGSSSQSNYGGGEAYGQGKYSGGNYSGGSGYNQYGGGYQNYSNSYNQNYQRQSNHSPHYTNQYGGQQAQATVGGNYSNQKQQQQNYSDKQQSHSAQQSTQQLKSQDNQQTNAPNGQASKKQKQQQAKLQQSNKEKETQKVQQQKLKQQTQEQQKTIQKQNILIKEQEMNLHRLQEQFKEQWTITKSKPMDGEDSSSQAMQSQEESKNHYDSRASGFSSQKSLGEEPLKVSQDILEGRHLPDESLTSEERMSSLVRTSSKASEDKLKIYTGIQIEQLQKSADSSEIKPESYLQAEMKPEDLQNSRGATCEVQGENAAQNQDKQLPQLRNNPKAKASTNGESQACVNEEGFLSPQPQVRTDTYYRKIFVGGLPHNLQDEEFKAYFLQYGDIEDSAILKDKRTGKPRGFGFVTYRTIQQVDFVMGMKDSHFIQGKWVDCKRAVPANVLKKETPEADAISQGMSGLKISGSNSGYQDNRSNSQNNSSNEQSDTSLIKQQQQPGNFAYQEVNPGFNQTPHGGQSNIQSYSNTPQGYPQTPFGQQNYPQSQGYFQSHGPQQQVPSQQNVNPQYPGNTFNQASNQASGFGMMTPEMMQNLQSIIRNTILQNPQLLSGPNTDINMLVSQIGAQLILNGGANLLTGMSQQNPSNNFTPGGHNPLNGQGQTPQNVSLSLQPQYMQQQQQHQNQFNQQFNNNQQNQFQQQQQQFNQNPYQQSSQNQGGSNIAQNPYLQYQQNQTPGGNYGPNQNMFSNPNMQQNFQNQQNQGQANFQNQGMQNQQQYNRQGNQTSTPTSPMISSQQRQGGANGTQIQQMNFNQVMPNNNMSNLSPIQNPKKLQDGLSSQSQPFKPLHQRQNSNTGQQDNPGMVFRADASQGTQTIQDSQQNSNFIGLGASPLYTNNQRQLPSGAAQNAQFSSYMQNLNQQARTPPQRSQNLVNSQNQQPQPYQEMQNQHQFHFTHSSQMHPQQQQQQQQQQFQALNQMKIEGSQPINNGFGMKYQQQQYQQSAQANLGQREGLHFQHNQPPYNQFSQANQGAFNMMQGSFSNQNLNQMNQSQDQFAEQMLKHSLQNPNESGDFPNIQGNQETNQNQQRQNAVNLQMQFQNIERQDQFINMPNAPSPIGKGESINFQAKSKQDQEESKSLNSQNVAQPIQISQDQNLKQQEPFSQGQNYQPAYIGQMTGFPSFQYSNGQQASTQFKSGFPYSDSFKMHQQQMQEQMNNSMSFSLGFGQFNQSMNMSIDSIGKKHQEQTEWYIQSLQKQFETSFTEDRAAGLDQLNETQNRLKGDTITGINSEIKKIQQKENLQQEKVQSDLMAKVNWSSNSRPTPGQDQRKSNPEKAHQLRMQQEEEKQQMIQNSFNLENHNTQNRQTQNNIGGFFTSNQVEQQRQQESKCVEQKALASPNKVRQLLQSEEKMQERFCNLDQSQNDSILSGKDISNQQQQNQQNFLNFKFTQNQNDNNKSGLSADNQNNQGSQSQNSSASLKTPQPQDDLSFNLKSDLELNTSVGKRGESETRQKKLDAQVNQQSLDCQPIAPPSQYNYVSKYNPFGAPSTASSYHHYQHQNQQSHHQNPYQQASQHAVDSNKQAKKRPPSQTVVPAKVQNNQSSQSIQRQQSQGNFNLLDQSVSSQDQPRRFILASGENFEFGKDRPSSKSSQEKERPQNFGSSFQKGEYGYIKSEQKQGPSNRADRTYQLY